MFLTVVVVVGVDVVFFFSDDYDSSGGAEQRGEQIGYFEAHRDGLPEYPGDSLDSTVAPPQQDEAERPARSRQEQLHEAGPQRAAKARSRPSTQAEGADVSRRRGVSS